VKSKSRSDNKSCANGEKRNIHPETTGNGIITITEGIDTETTRRIRMKRDTGREGATRMKSRGTDGGQDHLSENENERMRVGEVGDTIDVRGQLTADTKDIPGVQDTVLNRSRRRLSETNQSHEKIIGEGQGHHGEETAIQKIVDELSGDHDHDHQNEEMAGKKSINDQVRKKQFVRQNLQPCNRMLLLWRKIETNGWPRWRHGMLERKRRKIKGERRMMVVSSLHCKDRLPMQVWRRGCVAGGMR